jgi:hypothetical protein
MARRAASLAALLAAAALAGAVAGVDAGAATVLPSIYVDYGDDCTFTMHADGGLSLTSATAPGTTIPPGTYQVVLRVPQNAPSCPLQFQLQGPGVQLSWNFGGEALGAEVTETLQPASTYVATDLRNPTSLRAVFTTAASGSSSTLVTPTPSTATGKGQTSSDLVGSAISAYRGVLDVSLAPAGRVALTVHGRAVARLKAGRYDLRLDDESARGGLALAKAGAHTVTLSGVRFVGRRTARVVLTAGTWRLESGPRRAVTLVVSA